MYNLIVISCILLIILLNIIFAPAWITLLNLLIAFACVLVPSLIFLIVVRSVSKKVFSFKIFNVSKREIKFYEKIKIKKWKDKIPECGGLVNFKKDKLIPNPRSKEYIEKFIEETYYAEMTHFMAIISSFIGFLCVPTTIKLSMGLPIFLVYSILNLPSLFIQRYTRPRFIHFLNTISPKSDIKTSITT